MRQLNSITEYYVELKLKRELLHEHIFNFFLQILWNWIFAKIWLVFGSSFFSWTSVIFGLKLLEKLFMDFHQNEDAAIMAFCFYYTSNSAVVLGIEDNQINILFSRVISMFLAICPPFVWNLKLKNKLYESTRFCTLHLNYSQHSLELIWLR